MRRLVITACVGAICHVAGPAAAGAQRDATRDLRRDAGRDAGRDAVPISRLNDRPYSFTTYSGLSDSVDLVVRDSAVWEAAWRAIQQPFLPRPPLPTVDFQREMIIVTALGKRPSEGYDVVFENAAVDSSGIEVAVRVISPASGCPVNAAVTQPVDLARIPASGRPVRFRRRNVVVPCGVR